MGDVVPERYELELVPDLERYAFDGTVTITVRVDVATEVVTLHAKELVVWSATFVADSQGPCRGCSEVELDFGELSGMSPICSNPSSNLTLHLFFVCFFSSFGSCVDEAVQDKASMA